MANGTYLNRLAAQPPIRFRPRLLLLAAFLASAPLYPPNSYLMLRFAPNVSPAGDFLFAMLLSCFATALAILLFSAQRPSWPGFETRKGRPIATGCAWTYAAVLVAIWILLAAGYRNVVLFAALGVTAGACMAPVIMRWVRLYLMDFRSVMFYGAIACASSSAVAWIVSLLSDPFAVAAEGVLAITGSVLPLLFGIEKCTHETDEDAQSVSGIENGGGGFTGSPDAESPSNTLTGLASSLRTFLSIIWVPLLGFLVCSFMMAAYSFDADVGAGRSEYTGAIVASAVVVALCAMRLKSPFVMLIDRLAVPACVAVSIVLGSFPTGTTLFVAGAMLVYAPLALLSLFALSSLVAMAEAGEFPLPFVFSAAFLLSCAASLLGMTVQANVPPDVNLGPYLWVVLSSYFCIVVVHLGFVAWQQACSTDDPDALQDAGMRNEGETDTLHALQHERIVTLANGYALTKREREILQYLSLGYGSVYISKTLFISDNTACTHIRNIYRKLDVSSREELLSLVNGMK